MQAKKRSTAAASLQERKARYAKKSKLTQPDLRLVRKVISEGREVKFADSVINGTGSSYNGMTIVTASNITLGTTDQTRVGDKIKPYSFKMSYWVTQSTSAFLTTVRILVVQYNQANTGLTYGNILDYVGSVYSPMGGYANDYKDNFAVLYDKTHALQYPDGPSQATRTVRINRFPMGPIKYIAGGANHYNGIYVLAISSEQTNVPVIYATMRLKYTDA